MAPFWDYWFPTLLNLIPVYLQAIHTDSGYCVLLTVRLKLYSWSTVHSLKILTSFWFLWEQFWIRTYFWFCWIWTVIVEMAELAVRKMCLRCLPTFIFPCWLKKIRTNNYECQTHIDLFCTIVCLERNTTIIVNIRLFKWTKISDRFINHDTIMPYFQTWIRKDWKPEIINKKHAQNRCHVTMRSNEK